MKFIRFIIPLIIGVYLSRKPKERVKVLTVMPRDYNENKQNQY